MLLQSGKNVDAKSKGINFCSQTQGVRICVKGHSRDRRCFQAGTKLVPAKPSMDKESAGVTYWELNSVIKRLKLKCRGVILPIL